MSEGQGSLGADLEAGYLGGLPFLFPLLREITGCFSLFCSVSQLCPHLTYDCLLGRSVEADGRSLGDRIPTGTGGMRISMLGTASNPTWQGEGEQTSWEASVCYLRREGTTCNT